MNTRQLSTFFACLLSGVIIAATRSSASPPSPAASPGGAATDREIAALVQQLGDENFTVRNAAAARLAALGAPAYRAIRNIHSSDQEVQARLDQLKIKFTHWDGHEAIADYAARTGIAHARLALPLGAGKVSLNLALIPAGDFTMGSPRTEPERGPDETQHPVTISKPFYMGATPVTVDQFAVFAADSGYKTDAEQDGWSPGIVVENGQLNLDVFNHVPGLSWRKPSFDQKGDHPVVQISWNDATAFCAWLSQKSGMTVALPTEAQWEYACRAGTTTTFIWGDDPDAGKGWANSADQTLLKSPHIGGPPDFFNWDDGYVTTSPVAHYKANAFGLHDMNGNVFQWCQDWYGQYDNGPATDPTGPANGEIRITRGGSWNNQPDVARSAFRYHGVPTHRNIDYGFRVTVVVPDADVTPAPLPRPPS